MPFPKDWIENFIVFLKQSSLVSLGFRSEKQVLNRFPQVRGNVGRCGLLTFLSAEMRKCLLRCILPYKIKIKCFWKYLFLNDPKVQESMNREMFCFSLRGKICICFFLYHFITSNLLMRSEQLVWCNNNLWWGNTILLVRESPEPNSGPEVSYLLTLQQCWHPPPHNYVS